jgi:hypothetical protein
MTGADERGERSDLTAAGARRQDSAAPAARSGLRLVRRRDSEDGQTEREVRLLGEYNLYNG